MITHKPVLIAEVLEYLNPKPNENMIDGTVGEGGHARLILEKIAPHGKLLGIDRDRGQIENSFNNLKEYEGRIFLSQGSYVAMNEMALTHGVLPINGVLLDLGYSSWQMEKSGRGFSFNVDEPLDMRFDDAQELTAEMIVNDWPKEEIEKIITEYGEDKFARQIATHIADARRKRIKSTFELNDIIKQGVRRSSHDKIHYATRTFQALRIAVNDELGVVTRGIESAINLLASGGRLVVISFHSLEDRIVKNMFKEKQQIGVVDLLTKKPITASDQEIGENPRSRSAKLRAIVKI